MIRETWYEDSNVRVCERCGADGDGEYRPFAIYRDGICDLCRRMEAMEHESEHQAEDGWLHEAEAGDGASRTNGGDGW